ncbi:MAG: hypothetical protein LKE40_04675 [Spirochaetia bacterium]|jgi:fatty acid desaturase|nr:hypothetical protein [Spirochaetia bacterium]
MSDDDGFSPFKIEMAMAIVVISLLVGFIALGLVWHGSFVIKLVVGIIVAAVIIMLCYLIYKFDKEFSDSDDE